MNVNQCVLRPLTLHSESVKCSHQGILKTIICTGGGLDLAQLVLFFGRRQVGDVSKICPQNHVYNATMGWDI